MKTPTSSLRDGVGGRGCHRRPIAWLAVAVPWLAVACVDGRPSEPTGIDGLAGPSLLVTASLTPSTFVPFVQPIGIVATTDRLLVTRYCTIADQPTIFSIADDGVVSVFAPTFPTATVCLEKYLDVSPGLGGFPKDHVYVTQGREIFEITPDGSMVTLFATISSPVTDHTGIHFDRVGTFGHDMIVTAVNGDVFRINSAGTVTMLANTGTFHENPEVVPVGFGPLGGQIWTAAEFEGKVFAISPPGDVSVVAVGIVGAESINVIPSTVCEFGNSGGAFFVTDFSEPDVGKTREIDKFPASDFAGLEGDVLVINEFGGPIVRISLNATATGYVTSLFGGPRGQDEGGTFARCPISPEATIDAAINELGNLVEPDAGSPLAEKLNDAIDKLQTALDELNKIPPDNQAAVGTLEGAVGDVEAAVKDGLLDAAQGEEIEEIMDELAGAARQLAESEIEDATARGGDLDKIVEAGGALAAGDALRGEGAFKDAVNKYKDALAKAEGA